ncbi:TonB-dependent receptor [uncultured Imperialibacter sp.]|uniref:TonB-dependent receptor n=1 Tax=uncultured Imperialibacter sp. TaxID=1672639 RepID=UPI0030D7D0E7|tara:strand:+ start:50301 stop:52685 length:2385 start_codon:yes stop_codon:yes gene_type:complete
MRRGLLTITFLAFSFATWAQQACIQGIVLDAQNAPLQGATISVPSLTKGTNADTDGTFLLCLEPGSYQLEISFVGYKAVQKPVSLAAGDSLVIQATLNEDKTLLAQVTVVGKRELGPPRAGEFRVTSKELANFPAATADISRILATLPGVVASNELSSAYSVRGGNFDENLVYVNDIPVYRPFLVRAGQQEGLGFVNLDMVSGITFSSGGWQSKYGDKLSSVLNVGYKNPVEQAGSVNLGLLGGSAHVEGVSKNDRVNYTAGVRYKNSRYLLNTISVKGQYLPRFADFQSLVSVKLGQQTEAHRQKISILASYAQNRYFTKPESQEVEFGTFGRSFRMVAAFDGKEVLDYDIYQSGVKWTNTWDDKFNLDVIASGVYTVEREYFEVEGAYRLCDVNNNPASDQFKDCVVVRGVGSNYHYGRNKLQATLLNTESRFSARWSDHQLTEAGLGARKERIEDVLNEYIFQDSSGYASTTDRIWAENLVDGYHLTGYLQHTVFSSDSIHILNAGVRTAYWTVNGQLLVSPRMQYVFTPAWSRKAAFKVAGGVYQQPPFYREMRNRQGVINRDLKAQVSYHALAGMDYAFQMNGRNFVFFSEAYVKYLDRLVPYDIDNVRLRYFGDNLARGWAYGVDFRVNGEFIPGTESWFSLGLLRTIEDIEGDTLGFIRRPSDQRVTLGIFFQDYLPNDPSVRIYVSALYGSGLPFSAPNNPTYRNFFKGDEYYRVDVGFTKVFSKKNEGKIFGGLKSIWLTAEILNLLGAENTISYTWVKDVFNQQFAVPNSLSARFLNVKLSGRF